MSNWSARPLDYWSASPYPGERPAGSWLAVGSSIHRLAPVDGDCWRDTVTGNPVRITDRRLVLAYGSNANPLKISHLDAVMIDAKISDAQAVWCDGRRRTDRSVVATLVEMPGHIERCPVLALRSEDLLAVDGWEFPAYTREGFWGGCVLDNGETVTADVYVGGPLRQPLVVAGEYLPLHEYDHAHVDRLVR